MLVFDTERVDSMTGEAPLKAVIECVSGRTSRRHESSALYGESEETNDWQRRTETDSTAVGGATLHTEHGAVERTASESHSRDTRQAPPWWLIIEVLILAAIIYKLYKLKQQ